MVEDTQPKRATRGRIASNTRSLVQGRNNIHKYRGALAVDISTEKAEGGHRPTPTVGQRRERGSERIIINKANSFSLNAIQDTNGGKGRTTPNLTTILH